MKVWIASAKLSRPEWLGMLIVFPNVGLVTSVMRVVLAYLFGESLGWSASIAYVLVWTLSFLGVGLVLGAATFNIVVPWTRYEIWKNNQVLSRKERDEIERQKGEI